MAPIMMGDALVLLAAGLLAPVAFLLPGWLISRRLGSPIPIVTAFLVSAVLWFGLVLTFDILGIRLARGPLLGSWSGLCACTAWWARNVALPSFSGTWRRFIPHGVEWLWFAAALIGLASIIARAVIDPLSGWDNGFRWDFLARALLARGNLHFYPPVNATDFEIYAWCDGIPPLVPFLNTWLYLVTDTTGAGVAAVRVIAEALLIGACVFGLACELWGERGGWPAVGMLGTSALFLWGVAQGQETGLLALTLVALVWLLERHHRAPQARTAMWAGLAASVGALSREYALAFPLLGLGVLAVRDGRRGLGMFTAVAAVVAAPWYLRNWALTGNPLYPQSLGGLFPTNSVYADMMRRIGDYWQFDSAHVKMGSLAATLAGVMGVTLLAGAIGAWQMQRRTKVPLVAILLVAGLWLWSVPQTAGGINYSLRVLVPAVALLAALVGLLGTLPVGSGRLSLLIAVLIFSVDATRRAWLLPVFPLAPVLPWSFETWRLVKADIRHVNEHPLWDILAPAARGGLIVVDSPNAHTALTLRGGRAAMLFSPVLAPCFADKLPFDNAVRQLRSAGVRLLVLSVADPIARSFINAHPFFHRLCDEHVPLLSVDNLVVFDLDRLRARTP